MSVGESPLAAKREALLAWFGELAPHSSDPDAPIACAVAYSGGVDSAVAAQAACLSLGTRAVAVTGVSASLASGELEAAAELARRIGIRHLVLRTGEFASSEYVRNAPDRCYHCKTELYTQLERWAAGFTGVGFTGAGFTGAELSAAELSAADSVRPTSVRQFGPRTASPPRSWSMERTATTWAIIGRGSPRPANTVCGVPWWSAASTRPT